MTSRVPPVFGQESVDSRINSSINSLNSGCMTMITTPVQREHSKVEGSERKGKARGAKEKQRLGDRRFSKSRKGKVRKGYSHETEDQTEE